MRNKIENIINKLNEASDAYYNGLPEIMTNYEWDALFDELKKLEDETGIILPNSPTQNVSEDNTPGQKIKHQFPALSLAKTKDVNDLIKWSNDMPVWMSWKEDGLTLVATYKKYGNKAKLHTLVTRGNGETGTIVTQLAPYITGLPLEIEYPYNITVRGEAIISYEDFEIVNANNNGAYANPRNLASGSIALLNEKEFEKRRIHFIAFTLVYTDENINSWGDRMNLLEILGFEVVERVKCNTANDIKNALNDFTSRVENSEYKYPVDGLVITYDDIAYTASGTSTGHHSNRGGLAFKWADETVETSLKFIEWSCSTNTITPVAVFEPIDILGSTVQRASLHNVSEMKRMLGNKPHKEQKLWVAKMNMIIPQIVQAEKNFDNNKILLDIPKYCPACGAPTIIDTSNSGTETLICTNENCSAKNLKKYTRFVARAAMDIDGLSAATLSTFMNKGWINSYKDIYLLPQHKDEIEKMDGFGKKSMHNLITALNASKTVTADRFLFALSIPQCGREVARTLMLQFTFDEFLDLLLSNDNTILNNIEGFGPEKSLAIHTWINNNISVINDLRTIITIIDIKKEVATGSCIGYTFVITGNVNQFKNRDELKAYIEDRGGKIAGGVSSKTSYLINNDITSTSGKNKKAKELGIEIITEEEFLKRF